MTDHEINEIRTNIGRQWDDMARWAATIEIREFFKIDPDDTGISFLLPSNPSFSEFNKSNTSGVFQT